MYRYNEYDAIKLFSDMWTPILEVSRETRSEHHSALHSNSKGTFGYHATDTDPSFKLLIGKMFFVLTEKERDTRQPVSPSSPPIMVQLSGVHGPNERPHRLDSEQTTTLRFLLILFLLMN